MAEGLDSKGWETPIGSIMKSMGGVVYIYLRMVLRGIFSLKYNFLKKGVYTFTVSFCY